MAGSGRATHRDLIWWCAVFDGDVRAPIVGIELNSSDRRTEQWLLTDRGVRRYRSEGTKVAAAAGPPLPTGALPEDLDQVRGWLTHYLPGVAPSHALPTQAVASAGGMADIVDLLDACWPDRRIDPPAGITPYEIASETESFPHGLAELLAAFKNVNR